LWEAGQSRLPKSAETSEVSEPADVSAWLRRLLANNLRDEIRKQTAARRDVRRESSLEAALEASSARIAAWLRSEQSSPSQRVVRGEDLHRLAEVLAELPDDQRQAIEWHHLQGRPLTDVAHELGRTKDAVAALLYRALKKLRERLDQ
jgi:RNA polymerase sigma-70 factor (ECF subfamily)